MLHSQAIQRTIPEMCALCAHKTYKPDRESNSSSHLP